MLYSISLGDFSFFEYINVSSHLMGQCIKYNRLIDILYRCSVYPYLVFNFPQSHSMTVCVLIEWKTIPTCKLLLEVFLWHLFVSWVQITILFVVLSQGLALVIRFLLYLWRIFWCSYDVFFQCMRLWWTLSTDSMFFLLCIKSDYLYTLQDLISSMFWSKTK